MYIINKMSSIRTNSIIYAQQPLGFNPLHIFSRQNLRNECTTIVITVIQINKMRLGRTRVHVVAFHLCVRACVRCCVQYRVQYLEQVGSSFDMTISSSSLHTVLAIILAPLMDQFAMDGATFDRSSSQITLKPNVLQLSDESTLILVISSSLMLI